MNRLFLAEAQEAVSDLSSPAALRAWRCSSSLLPGERLNQGCMRIRSGHDSGAAGPLPRAMPR